MLRFYWQYAIVLHAKMELGLLVYRNSDGPTKKDGLAALRDAISSPGTLVIFPLHLRTQRYSVYPCNGFITASSTNV